LGAVIGRTLSHYRIQEEIRRGGMGVVYRAIDTKLDREVAVKVLPPELVDDESRRRLLDGGLSGFSSRLSSSSRDWLSSGLALPSVSRHGLDGRSRSRESRAWSSTPRFRRTESS
jgi:serine/threonine protein kinase